MKTLTIRIWFGPNDFDIKPGFTRTHDDNLNTLRIGKLQVAFGIEPG